MLARSRIKEKVLCNLLAVVADRFINLEGREELLLVITDRCKKGANMKKAGKRAKARFEFLERQIDVQQDALARMSGSMQDAVVHATLLERLTDEWCEMLKTYGDTLYA